MGVSVRSDGHFQLSNYFLKPLTAMQEWNKFGLPAQADEPFIKNYLWGKAIICGAHFQQGHLCDSERQ